MHRRALPPRTSRAGRRLLLRPALIAVLLAPAALAHPAAAAGPRPAEHGAGAAARPISGGRTPAAAARIAPGQYADSIGPGETRWYAATLDAASTDDLAVTALPRPGVPVGYDDGIELRLASTGPGGGATCGLATAHFGQDEGAMPLTGAVSRIPSNNHEGACDPAGRYLLAVHRTSAAGSDQARWPLRIDDGVEPALPPGTVPAPARTDFGTPPPPPAATARPVTGGTGFDDAPLLTAGVWHDTLQPARPRYYRVHLGWGRQLSYSADIGSASAGGPAGVSTFATTAVYAPGRLPVESASDARADRPYDGTPVSVGFGTVPVAWTNRWADAGPAQAVHRAGDYWIALGLGPDAARSAKGAAIGVVLRIQVSGVELAGPQYQAPPLHPSPGSAAPTGTPSAVPSAASGSPGAGTASPPDRASATAGGSRTTGSDLLAAATGGAVALAGIGATALIRRARARRHTGPPAAAAHGDGSPTANRTDRGGA